MSEMQQQAPLESLEGKQIGLQEYVEYKKNFNEERTLTFSSSDLYRQRKLEQDREITANLFWGASTLGLGALLVQAGNSNDSIRALLEAMPMARLARQKAVRQALENKAAGVILESVHGTHAFGRQTVQQSIHSMLMGVEELSPLQLLKTLQLSSFSSLFAQSAAEATEALHLREASIRAHADYYFQLIKAEGNKQLSQQNIEDGFILKNNKLYQAVKQLDGSYKEGDVLLNSARMIHAGTVTGTDAVSTNRVFEKFSNMYGVGINRQAIQVEPMVIVGARSNERLAQSWFRSYGRFALELGAKSLDNPLGFIEEYLSLTDTSRKVFSTKAWQLAKKYTNIQLGSGGIYNISSREMMLRTGKNLAVKGAIAAIGYQAADSMVQFLAPEGSAWDNGIVAGLAAATMRAHIGFAETWSDNFQDIKKTQENAAPGSTSLITLAGLPLAGAMLGANLTYFQRMGDSLVKGVDEASVKHVTERAVRGLAGSLLQSGGITLEGNTLARRAKLGALGGAVLALPFLPGALVGKSSEELKKEYSGEKKVAVRKTRWWLCMSADSLVFGAEGLKRADEVKVEDQLFNTSGNTGKVLTVHKRYTKERMFSVSTKCSLTTYTKVTEDHKILTERGWVAAKNLALSDKLVAPIPKLSLQDKVVDLGDNYPIPLAIGEDGIYSVQRTYSSKGVPIRVNNKLSNRFLSMSFKTGKFLGWFLAEGHLHWDGDKAALEISFHQNERPFAEEMQRFLKEDLGTRGGNISCNTGKGLRLRFGCKPFAHFVYNFLYRNGKKIFPNLEDQSSEFVRGFLIGMFYGDGNIKKVKGVRSTFCLKSASIQHLFEFRRYATCFGAYGSIRLCRETGTYALDISGESGSALHKLGVYKQMYKYEVQKVGRGVPPSYQFSEGKLLLSIGRLEDFIYEGYVYDYTMSSLHEYMPESFIIHNSGGEHFEGGQVKYHRDHLLRVLATDARTKTLYGDRATARDLNPIFSPFKYLKNPYAFEEMHTHDAPMPVWGMDTSYGSFLGQLFKGTVGQVIKPTVIHPELLKVREGGIDYSDNHLKKRGINYLTTKLQDLAEEQSRPPITAPTSSLPHLQLQYQSIDEMGDRDIVQTVESDFDSDGKYIGDGTVREPIVDPTRLRLDSDAFTTPLHEKKDVKSLIDDGWMLRANAPTNEPYTRASQSTWSALEEFVGLKGFVGGLALEAVTGAAPTDQLRPELEVSGSMTNMSNTIMDMQLGDALGCFTPETLVRTSKGYEEIQHINTKNKVLSLNYKYQKVLEVHKKHFSNIPLCYVSVQGMCRFIRCTPDHKFPSIKPHDMQIVDRPMGDLSEGDYILMVDHKYLNATCRMIAQLKGKRSPIYRAVKIVSKVTGRYTGYMYDLAVDNTPYYTVYDCICHNSGEFLRRLFPQSASSKRETVNPMRNLVAPSWLPQNTTKYHVDFAQGAYFKNEMGEVLNPGTKGFEELNPHLKGVNPEDYPLVYQYQVLQNIARYSPEHIAVKEYLVRNLESLSDVEKDVFFEAYAQDTLRDQYKKFSEYATEEEKSKMGLFAMHNALWETIAHKENPLEPLLPFRPMAKFVHQRTAIEDYRKAVVYGPDTGIWTNPKSHFIDPAIHRTVGMFNDHLPDDYEEKARVDALFDNLALLKADKNGKDYDFDRNITALSYSGVMDAEAMHRFRMALPEEQRPYVEAFSREKDADKRAEILSMVPSSVGAVYQSIWQNIDIYDKAVHEGKDPMKALEKEYLKDTKTLARKVEVEDKFSFNLFGNIEMEEAREIRRKAAIKHAENHVKSVLGSIPSERWIGWDPRLKMDDIKLKTLMVGKEDLHKYGFWDKDRERVERLVVLDQEAEVITDLDKIKEGSKALDRKEMALRQRLRAAGFETYRITNTKSPRSDKIVIKDTEAYLNNYYGSTSTGDTE